MADLCVAGNGTSEFLDWAALDGPHPWAVGIEAAVLLYCFAGLAIVCDDFMATALETLCVRWHLREDVAGATFLAIGSAAPEIVINVVGVIRTRTSADPEAVRLGVSAIIGSGMVAFLLAPGVCALSATKDMVLKRRPLLRDVGFYSVSCFFLVYFFRDGLIRVWEAAILLGLYLLYLATTVLSPQIRHLFRTRIQGKPARDRLSFVHLQKMQDQANDDDDDDDDAPIWDQEGGGGGGGGGGVGGGRSDSDSNGGGDDEPLFRSKHDDRKAGSEAGSEDDVAPPGWRAIPYWLRKVLLFPLHFAFKWTCPDCEEGAKYEHLYPVAILMSFAWVGVFSYLISTLISRWSSLLGIPTVILGMTVVSLGGEIPDTLQSVSVAKRGYGSLAVSNCIGSKVVNIGIGLGLPWLLSAASGAEIFVCGHQELQVVAIFHSLAVALFFCLTLVAAWSTRANKATLGYLKGGILLAGYIVFVAAYVMYYYLKDV